MENIENLSRLPELLLPWFYREKRILPWRSDREPYHIWLSEIMLQQTRVEAVKGYYSRFLEKLPDVQALAQAPDDLVHKLWEGLGYYTRARNLKKAAQVIVSTYGGRLPRDYQKIRALPGIGDYTAGAIASIAFNQREPAVDGNVMRVLSRLTCDETPVDLPQARKTAAERLRVVYPPEAGDFTQALMELGATVCGPNRKPDCGSCPCQDICLAYQNGTAEALPVRLPKKSRRQEEKTVFLFRYEDSIALQKRQDTGLLAGLWELPNVPGLLTPEQALVWAKEKGLQCRDLLRKMEKTHIFTHIQWNMWGYVIALREPGGDFVWKTCQQLSQEAALPTAFRIFLEEWDNV